MGIDSLEYLAWLRQVLDNRLLLEDLITLCFDLGVNYHNLPGETLSAKITGLLDLLAKREQIQNLIDAGKKVRPDIPWEGKDAVGTPPQIPTLSDAHIYRILQVLLGHSNRTIRRTALQAETGLSDADFARAENHLLNLRYVAGTPGPDGWRYITSEGSAFWGNRPASSPPPPLPRPAIPSIDPTMVWQQRLDNLVDSVQQDQALLKEYEDTLRYEDDPRRRARYKKEIESLGASVKIHWREYQELQAQGSREAAASIAGIGASLSQINAKMDSLLIEQSSTRDDLAGLRQSLLARYDASERLLISTLAGKLDHAQLATVQAVHESIEADQVSKAEMEQILGAIQQQMEQLKQQGVVLPEQDCIDEIVSPPTLDVTHKLKVSLPIIPLLLAYEAELGLGSEVNLELLWEKLIKRVVGEPSHGR